MLNCNKHPKYQAKRAPMANCILCRSMWARSLHRKDFLEKYQVSVPPKKLEIGTILVYTWGYGQTNIDFFQVTKRSAKSVQIREIAKDIVVKYENMCGLVAPVPNEFVGMINDRTFKTVSFVTKIIKNSRGGEYLSMAHGNAIPTTANDVHFSSWWY